MRHIALLLAALLALVAAPLAAQPEFPALTGRVVDAAERFFLMQPEVSAVRVTGIDCSRPSPTPGCSDDSCIERSTRASIRRPSDPASNVGR